MSDATELARAYAHCEDVTRAQAANFFYGIRLLARERRRGMCAVYAFARRVDDIGDGTLAREEKLSRLDAEAAALGMLETGRVPADGADPVIVALADAYARFALPAGALGELIEGVRMDVTGVSYERFEDLVLYCRRVAGAIGRVCLAIFGSSPRASASPEEASRLADDLGVALQLTNILRDVREDAQNGRAYLPAEDLRRFGLLDGTPPSQAAGEAAPAVLASLTGPAAGANGREEAEAQRLYELMRFEAARAREWFDRGLTLVPLLDRRSAACVLAMAGIYRRLLERIEADPETAAHGRVSLPTHEKALVAARSMLGGRR
ncbi:MAG TPA: squalene/phytoene synthase family protein [Solirubrobacteraceae bacterium]|jgi:phytoene synthase|nr:squalene/phytoene synthase family protein [Solirubrobacteraceae bacterium]